MNLNIKSWLIWACLPLLLIAATYQHAVSTLVRENGLNAAAIKQIHHDPRIWQLAQFEKQHHFAPDQLQYVKEIIQDADSNSIPAALLVCVEFQESSGGKRFNYDTHNPFGWNSDKTGFASERAAIDYISAQLGHGYYYAGKTLEGKLHAYNPNPAYSIKIINCINNVK